MFNYKKLENVLVEYKKDFASKQWNNEKYKWEAVKHFQDHWDINAADFLEMFWQATEKTYNLLASRNYFPRRMIKFFAEHDPEVVRSMFISLFDESKDLVERYERFVADAEELKEKYIEDKGKQHYQHLNAISTYLWLRYPDKYYIYKYSVNHDVAKELESSIMPKRGRPKESLVAAYNLYNEICEKLAEDNELKQMLQSLLTDDCYPDSELRTLTMDLGFYISTTYSNKTDNGDPEWFPTDYSPGISTEQWLELLSNKEVFTPDSLAIMKRMKDIGGMATCKQLSTRYGETPNFYNTGSSSLARRVAKVTGCPLLTKDTRNSKWWPILYHGKYVDKDTEGVYTWKLRDELSSALDQYDLSSIPLYATRIEKSEPDTSGSINYWWLNANPIIWSISDMAVGSIQSYSLYNENGNKRRIFQNFLDAKAGDIVIGYETSPVKQIVALAEVFQENDGEKLYFKKVEGLSTPIDYSTLKEYPELEKMEYFINPQGSLFKLTKSEYEIIMDIIRDANPVTMKETFEIYTKEDFLDEVYITGESYDSLVSLLKHKKNIILQGAPGVGKTFAAKRLAYAMMGEKDEDRIEVVQFHQSYSYEDFVMGYKPKGNEYELKRGVFYRFCQKVANDPDNKEYFFIIDEINRGNLSKIFGELLMLIEKDYRGTKATLAYSEIPFAVPENLYIIGMMNTADRSLAMIDYALRRRFSFYEMEPGFNSDGFKADQKSLDNETFNVLIDHIKELNRDITTDSSLGKGFCIGHSYFCNQEECTDEWMMEIVEYDIIPMLSEYWFDEQEKLQRWENILRGVFND
jgi:5-methylcytosine-specific restriction protein B